jgi:hypothetical protein
MPRLILIIALLLSCAIPAAAATASTSDQSAITLAQQSVAALAGGASVSDVTVNANVISILGSDNETGTGTFTAKGLSESRVDLNLSGGTRSDVRNATNGAPAGAWSKNGNTSTVYAGHNCYTDAAWFFPALSSLTQTANPNFVFKYIGQEQHGGVNTQHIRVYQSSSQSSPISALSTMDFYLDAVSSLPMAIGFESHPDNNMGANIPTEIDFANYQPVNGFKVPFHFQKIFNGLVVLDVTVTSATFNSGLADTLFTLQ